MLILSFTVPMNCGYCGREVQAFCVVKSRDSVPGLTPAFCSDRCANTFLLKEELKQKI